MTTVSLQGRRFLAITRGRQNIGFHCNLPLKMPIEGLGLPQQPTIFTHQVRPPGDLCVSRRRQNIGQVLTCYNLDEKLETHNSVWSGIESCSALQQQTRLTWLQSEHHKGRAQPGSLRVMTNGDSEE
jgi:hypothetical protein